MKKTLLVGATINPGRYAYLAARMLDEYGHEWIPIGIKSGSVFGREIVDLRMKPSLDEIDTISLYIGPRHQGEWMGYLLGLAPRRIIFNPGTENAEFESAAEKLGIEAIEGCTLVMLRSGQF